MLQADPANIIMDYFDDPTIKIIPPGIINAKKKIKYKYDI